MSFRTLLAATAAGALALTSVAAAPALPAGTESPPNDGELPVPRVVVGTADTGINPYHEWFQVDEPAVTQHVLDDFGIDDDHVLRISDSYQADAGAGVFDDVVAGEDYWFAGTNIIARAEGSATPFIPDGSVHGVGVTASIVAGNPEAIVYFAESSSNIDEVFNHPQVDIVSTSFGAPTGVPVFPISGSYAGVVEQGKLYFAATTNDPSLQPMDNASGPWWAIGVAGFEEGTSEGKQVLSGSTPDVVADFTQQLPYCATCTSDIDQRVAGTSFATPLTAGTVSRVLLEVRRATGHLGGITGGMLVDADGVQVTNWDVRRAVEQGAYVPPFTDPSLDHLAESAAPVNPLAPYVQVGWGLVTPDPEHEVVAQTLAALGFGELTRTKSAATCDFMTAQVLSRMATWDANPTSPSLGETNALGGSPHEFC